MKPGSRAAAPQAVSSHPGQGPPDLLRAALPAEPDPALATAAERPRLREAALEALAAARSDHRRAASVLSRWFRKTRWLGSRDRPVVSAAVFGIIRHEHLLLRAGARSAEDLHAGWCRLAAGDRFAEIAALSPAEDLATALTLPYPVAAEWLTALGAQGAAALAASLTSQAPVTLRANALECSREQLAARLAEEGVTTRPTEQARCGLHVEGRRPLTGLRSFREGWFEVQDEASQLLAEAIPLQPGQQVLDVCAGAGGKSLALAARGARVQAWDIRDRALRELARRAERAGADVEIGPPEEPAPVVLVDAPCSGVGRLRRDPALRWGLEVGAHVELQRQLLAEASEWVAPGGLLVYATCSLLSCENRHAPTQDWSPGDWTQTDERWLWPHAGGTDGFFWRMWRQG